MPELNISRDVIDSIIERVKEFQSKEDVVIPEDVEEFNEDDFMQILADHQNDLIYLEVKDAIDDLEPDQQMMLVALMYLGRGDYSVEEWEDCLLEAQNGWTTHTAEYILSHPYAANYLEEALDILGD